MCKLLILGSASLNIGPHSLGLESKFPINSECLQKQFPYLQRQSRIGGVKRLFAISLSLFMLVQISADAANMPYGGLCIPDDYVGCKGGDESSGFGVVVILIVIAIAWLIRRR